MNTPSVTDRRRRRTAASPSATGAAPFSTFGSFSVCCLLLLLAIESPTTTSAFTSPSLSYRRIPSSIAFKATREAETESPAISKTAQRAVAVTRNGKTNANSKVNSNNSYLEQRKQGKNVNGMDLSKELITSEEATAALAKETNDNNEASIWLWRGVVVVLCALWASNFAAAKLVMAEPGVDSSLYAVARFSVAALALLPGSIRAVKQGLISWETAKGAAICGSWVSFGYLGQTLGLLTTTASRSCVICALHCVFVAALAEFLRVQVAQQNATPQTTDSDNNVDETSFDLMRLVPAAVAVLGVAIVELKGAGGEPSIGDLLSFAQPIGFGFGYFQLEQLMKQQPEAGLPVSAIKLIMVALFSFIMFEIFPIIGPFFGASAGVDAAEFALRIPDFSPILASPLALGGILYTGLITTALALWVESIAFKRVPATDASIILTTEPLFAAAAGALTLGETFGTSDYVGATLIIGACALAVLMDGEEDENESGVVIDCAVERQ